MDTLPEPNFDRITKLSAAIFGHPVSTLALADRDRFWFKSKHGVDAIEMPRHMAFCAETIRGDAVLVVPDAREDARFANAPGVAGPPHFRFYAGAPLVTPTGSRIGSLCVLSMEAQRGFSASHQSILADLASTVVELFEARARQIELAQCTAEIAFLARHDPLTGLANRRQLAEMMDLASGECRIALFYLDLDGFKGVNDRYGHACGDALLLQVADRLRESLPADASVARLGGDEFAVLLSGHDDLRATAEATARRLNAALSRSYCIGSRTAEIGVSIGIALVHGDLSLDDSLSQADAALYAAKSEGRGCYRFAAEAPRLPGPGARHAA